MIYYTIYETQISLFIEGDAYNIPVEDSRFKEISKLLVKEDFQAVRELVELERLFTGQENLRYQDGVLFYKEEQVASSLGDLIISSAQEKRSYEHYLNFHVALKYNKDFVSSPHKRKLFYRNFKDIYLLGDTVFYDASEKLPIDNFYSLDSFPNFFIREIVKLKDVRLAIEEIAGFKSEKLIKLFKKESLEKGVNDNFLNFLVCLKGLVNPTALYELWEKVKGTLYFNNCSALNSFLSKYKTSEKGIVNFIENSQETSLTRLTQLLLQAPEETLNLPEFSSAQEIIPVIQREITRLNQAMFFLNQEEFYPALKDLVLKIENLELVIPQTNEELEEWSEILSNCIRTYAQSAKKGEVLLLGVKKEDKLIYALEIRGKSLRQFQAKYNHAVPKLDHAKVVTHLKESKLLK